MTQTITRIRITDPTPSALPMIALWSLSLPCEDVDSSFDNEFCVVAGGDPGEFEEWLGGEGDALEFLGFDLSGVALSGVALSCEALSGVALSGVELSGVALSGVALSGEEL